MVNTPLLGPRLWHWGKRGVAGMGAQRPQAATRAREGLAGAWVGASLAGGVVVVAVLRPFWPKNGEQL